MDLHDLQRIHIQPRYEIYFDPKKRGLGDIFRSPAAAVLWCAIAASHRRSSVFDADVRHVRNQWRKLKPQKRPQTGEDLEKFLWQSCRDKSLKCPWRPDPQRPRLVLTAFPETAAEWNEREARTRAEWLRLMQELCDAMHGRRKCEIVVMPMGN